MTESPNPDLLYFNGINGETGGYAAAPMTAAEIAARITGESPPENLAELRAHHQRTTADMLGPKEGVDPQKLEESGWGVIFPAYPTDQTEKLRQVAAIREALAPLLQLRAQQAGERFTAWAQGADKGFLVGRDAKNRYLARYGVGPGPADPDKVPYYLLLVGSPEEIPYRFQSQLDVQYAVGRIHFDTLDEYAAYARSVVAAERGEVKIPRTLSFLGAANPDDQPTDLSAQYLVEPLFQQFQLEAPDWYCQSFLRDEATKNRLTRLLSGEQTPALLFAATHGMSFLAGSPQQLAHQGALLCQDWPGPERWGSRPIPQDFYFAGDDLPNSANPHGLIAFFFACFGAGTPQEDDFAVQGQPSPMLAPQAFLAQLPRRLLSLPSGGALAVIGHVDRVRGYSFIWPHAGAQTTAFSDTIKRLLAGDPVGSALEPMNQRYAELSTLLNDQLEGGQNNPDELAGIWTANRDARGYALIGDPAVRLVVQASGSAQTRPVSRALEVSGSTPPVPSTVAPTASYAQPPVQQANVAYSTEPISPSPTTQTELTLPLTVPTPAGPEYIYGMDGRGAEQLMLEAGRRGWVLQRVAVGPNQAETPASFAELTGQGLGVLVHLVYRTDEGYGERSVQRLPPVNLYREFVDDCARYVQSSSGCHWWMIGDHELELTPTKERLDPAQRYAALYQECRAAIRRLSGHQEDHILLVGPHPAIQSRVLPEEDVRWISYFDSVLDVVARSGCDGLAVGASTSTCDTQSITQDHYIRTYRDQQLRLEFRAYQDFLERVPASLRQLPLFLIDVAPGWPTNKGWQSGDDPAWVTAAYDEVARWNAEPSHQPIQGLFLYRWSDPQQSQWAIAANQRVLDDFRRALHAEPADRYRIRQPAAPSVAPNQPLSATTSAIQIDDLLSVVTNQQLLNAFYNAARSLGRPESALLTKAGLDVAQLTQERQAFFIGPSSWPALSENENQQVERHLLAQLRQAPRWQGQVNAPSGLNLRAGPGTDRSVVAQLADQTRLDVLYEQGEWLLVAMPDGQMGYVHASFVRPASGPQLQELDDKVVVGSTVLPKRGATRKRPAATKASDVEPTEPVSETSRPSRRRPAPKGPPETSRDNGPAQDQPVGQPVKPTGQAVTPAFPAKQPDQAAAGQTPPTPNQAAGHAATAQENQSVGTPTPPANGGQPIGGAAPINGAGGSPPGGGGGGGNTTVINYSILERYEPPPDTVTIEVGSKTVKLRYGGREYTSPSRFAEESYRQELLALRLEKPAYGAHLFAGVIREETSAGGNPQDATLIGYGRALDDTQSRLRVVLKLDPNDVELHNEQWEYLWAPRNTPLAVLERSPFYRYIQGPTKSLQVRNQQKLKILVAIGNPTTLPTKRGDSTHPILKDLVRLDVEQERDIVDDALKRLSKEADGLLEYTVLDRDHLPGKQGLTMELLREELQNSYHVLHLLSHGVFIKGRQEPYFLVLEKEDGREEFVSADRFRALMNAGQDNLRLVVLAACQSANSQTGDTLLGLGPDLVRAGVPAVIAMQENMPVETAQLFTQHFYDDLARSGRIDMAMAATRLAIWQDEGDKRSNWGIPVLMMSIDENQSADDRRLFVVDRDKAASAPELKPVIKPYSELKGRGDPRPEVLTQMLQAQAQALGVPQWGALLQQAVSGALAGPASASAGGPLPAKQQRATLSAQLKREARLIALEPAPANTQSLQAYVAANSKLSLPPTVFAQLSAALNTGKHVILIGPPGTGKTSLANDLCNYAQSRGMNRGVLFTTATADWTTFDTVGGYAPTANQTLQFRPGCFLDAIREGKWLVIDEINRAEIDKAFGELFTVLSGQQVELPYRVGEQPVRILPPDNQGADGWVPAAAADSGYSYVVHPTWRIIGTMNVYDKSSLFSMSLAFMRRFAFVDLDLPDESTLYKPLRDGWIDRHAALQSVAALPDATLMKRIFDSLLDRKSALMNKRALGPAIVRDMIRYVGDRYDNRVDQESIQQIMAEACLLYAVPQLDGLDHGGITAIYTDLSRTFYDTVANVDIADAAGVLPRLRALYPYIPTTDWQAHQPSPPGGA